MSKSYNVLFLCHDNAGRSLMAEAMLNHLSHGKFHAYSAASQPALEAHPAAIDVLKKEGFDTQSLKPKSMQAFHSDNAPVMDIVISLCQNTTEDAEFTEWEDEPLTAHWHFDEPHNQDVHNSLDTDKDEYQKELHRYAMIQRQLSTRISLLLNIPDNKLDNMKLHH